LNDMFVAVLR